MPVNTSILCPVCQTAAGNYHVIATCDYRIFKCPTCGLEYTSPVPTGEQLHNFYENYADMRADPEIVYLNAQANLKLVKEYSFSTAPRILDYGCGDGQFVEIAGESCFGVEISSRKHGSRIFTSINDLPAKSFDVVTLWGVLEHIPDPVDLVDKLVKILTPGGLIALTTVNAEGVIPYYYKPPEHLTYWTTSALTTLFNKFQMHMELITPYSMFQLSDVYLDRLLSRTPNDIAREIVKNTHSLPKIVEIPTNELIAVARLSP